MSGNDMKIQLIISALDYATKDIKRVNQSIKELSKTLGDSEYSLAAKGMQSFGQAVKDSTDPIATATAKSLAFAGAITAVSTALGSRIYQSAVEYESTLSDLAKVLEGGREEAERYGKQLDELALQYASNGQDLLGAMANFKQAGFDAAEAFGLVESSLKLMIAGDLEAGESSEYLVSILKGFRQPASEAGRAVDILNEVSNEYATSVKELAAGMAKLSPVASQMGFSFEETAGLLTPVIEVYRSGSEASNALTVALAKLQDDAKPVQDTLAQIGVAQYDANGALRSGRDIFLDVARAMQSVDDNTRGYLAAQLVGIEQSGRFSTVLRDLGKYLDISAVAANAAGSASKEVAVRLDTADAAARRADESFRQLSRTLGKAYRDEVKGVITASASLADALTNSIDSGDLNPLVQAIRPQIAAIEALFQSIGDNIEPALAKVDWTPLVDGIRELGGEFGDALAALFDGFDLTTVDGLSEFIQRLINLMGDFSQYIAGVLDGLEPFMDTLNAVFGVISRGHPEMSNLLGELRGLATSANLVIPAISQLGATLFGVIGELAEFAFKIGLAVSALKLMQAAGLPVGAALRALMGVITALLPTLGTAIARFTGLAAAARLILPVAAALGGYKVGETLRQWGLDAGYAAEQGTLAAQAFDLLATEAEVAERHIAETAGKVSANLKEIAAATGLAIPNMREFNRLVDEGKLVFDKATGSWRAATRAVDDHAAANREMLYQADLQQAATRALASEYDHLGLTYDATSKTIRSAAETLGDASDRTKRAAKSEQEAWLETTKAHVSYGDWIARIGEQARQELATRRQLATEIGTQAERVRELSSALAEAERYNRDHGAGNDIAGAKQLAEDLGTAKQRYADLTQELAGRLPSMQVEVDDTQLDGVIKSVDALNGTTTYSDHQIADNVPDVLADLQQLDGHDTSSTHTVYVRQVEANASGGQVGRFVTTGARFGLPSWRVVPGTGNQDSVPAALPSGSYVLNKKASQYYGDGLKRLATGGLVDTLLTPGERWFDPATVNRHGLGLFEALNQLRIPAIALDIPPSVQALAAGGAVGAPASTPKTEALDINLRVNGGQPIKLQGARDQALSLARALRELQRGQ